ncbi:UDP-N-acetylglucosamine 2-epimerase [Gillisia sp. M10.2A]|uniref:UDP-N-acetylglucosamine 2-epimerase n=1 Tax=Gillisia lutea TaxID=2909668 RepID=A0ABS9EGW2_9FLAO|nr:UDP-N-acetylglucosamine 2-epimerase [Gillisia lutea]MCF4102128.1 UDP-N-acetylglucosamine 2-epimerase [Gillisia lutea]
MNRKRILFLTGTRADFGKIKSLIQVLEFNKDFEVFVFVTGMHLQHEYGYTVLEIERCNFSHVHTFENFTHETTMDLTLAKTIEGLSRYIKESKPDMIVVHGDRVETLAGAIVGSLNNILVAHIEGGEVSGTVDELIRHSVSKLSHIHYVSNKQAEKRLIQMGELTNSIRIIGSPDIDVMFSEKLPRLDTVKSYYDISFDTYAIAMIHPVTTEFSQIRTYAKQFVKAILDDHHNYIIVYPNNDLGSKVILEEIMSLKSMSRFRLIPSLRFEYFLTLLKNTKFIIGNSSAGIREAPYYGVPVINIGTRQNNRSNGSQIINVDYSYSAITGALQKTHFKNKENLTKEFGEGNSADKFLESLENRDIWTLNKQKQFRDLD